MLLLKFALAGVLRGQQIDTVLFRESHGTERFTIIDQLSDPQERRAFLKLYGAREPQKRRKLAEEFVAKVPAILAAGASVRDRHESVLSTWTITPRRCSWVCNHCG